MPNIEGAKKRLRQSIKRRERNKAVRTRVKSVRKTFLTKAAEADKATAETVFKEYCSVLDKAAKTGKISKNTAIRRKTRAANKIRAKA